VLTNGTKGQDVASCPVGLREPVGVDGHQWTTHPETVCTTEQPDQKEDAETERFDGHRVECGIVARLEW